MLFYSFFSLRLEKAPEEEAALAVSEEDIELGAGDGAVSADCDAVRCSGLQPGGINEHLRMAAGAESMVSHVKVISGHAHRWQNPLRLSSASLFLNVHAAAMPE